MKIVFVVRNPKLFYNVRSIVRSLLARRHDIFLIFDERLSEGNSFATVNELSRGFPGLQWRMFKNRRGLRAFFLFSVRELLSYRRYLKLPSTFLYYRRRWFGNIPLLTRWAVRILPFSRTILRTKYAAKILQQREAKTSPIREVEEYLKVVRPDVVVATPTTMHPQSIDLEFVKAAQRLNIPTVIPALTWDSLSTKGLIHIQPTKVFVWNAAQAREAHAYHSIPKSNITVIGAPTFDHWFSREYQPSISLVAFCQEYNFDPAQPIILYLGTSQRTAEDETWLVKLLRSALDHASASSVRFFQLLVRPHPMNTKVCAGWRAPHTAVVSKQSKYPSTESNIQMLFNMIHYATAVVGISTSGMIDAIILDTPVIAMMTERYALTQTHAPHFQQLDRADTIEKAYTPEECVSIFERLCKGIDIKKEQRTAFVQEYIRPRGNILAGEVVAHEIELLLKKRS